MRKYLYILLLMPTLAFGQSDYFERSRIGVPRFTAQDTAMTWAKVGGARQIVWTYRYFRGKADTATRALIADSVTGQAALLATKVGPGDSIRISHISDSSGKAGSLVGVDTSKIIWSNRASQTIGGNLSIQDTLKVGDGKLKAYIDYYYDEAEEWYINNTTIKIDTVYNAGYDTYNNTYFDVGYNSLNFLSSYAIQFTSLNNYFYGINQFNGLSYFFNPIVQAQFNPGNNRNSSAIYIQNKTASVTTIPHALLVVDRYGLASYEASDHLNGIRSSITSTNTDTAKSTQSGIWAYAQDDTGTLLSTANKYIGGEFGTYKYSTNVSPFATGVQSQISFGASGGAINNVWGFNSKVENLRSSDATINYGAAYHVDKSWSDTTAGTSRYAFWDESTLPSIFGGTVTAPTFSGALTGTASGNLVPADSNSIRNYSNSLYLKNADSSSIRNYSNAIYLKNIDSSTLKNSIKAASNNWTGTNIFYGNVSVGSSSPVANLHVSTNTDGKKQLLQTYLSVTGNYTGMLFKVSANLDDLYQKGGILFERTGASGVGSLHLAVDGTATTSNADLGDARLTINSSGNVGIGTTTPTEALSVVGGISSTRDVTVGGVLSADTVYGGSASGGHIFIFPTSHATKGNVYLEGSVAVGASGGAANSFNIGIGGGRASVGWDGSNSWAYLKSSGTDKPVTILQGTTERMRIAATTGNVGIGTTTPAGALDVTSTTGALIVPRMTTTQRDALTPVNGMIIFNTTTTKFNFYEGAWVTKTND